MLKNFTDFINFQLLTLLFMFKKNKKKSLSLNYHLTIVLSIIIAVSASIGVIISAQTNTVVDQKIAEAKEAARPANIKITSIVDFNCTDCFSLDPFIKTIKELNVNVESEETLNLNDKEAQELIKQFNITKVPTLVVTGEIKKDKALESVWKKIGKIENDAFILTQNGAPYVLTSTGDVKGRVQITMIIDRDCTECYDVTIHERILKQMGLNWQNEDEKITEVDFPDAQELIKKYSITLVPTVLISGDAGAYPALKQVWFRVGSVEDDGTYVFREGVKRMGTYRDLKTGEMVKPAKK
jgi:Na+-translocating ferredoxin:NAD+ oxidoreductase RnfG subunit